MQFVEIKKDWFKRRAPDKIKKVFVSAEVPDYKQEHNHMCRMHVTYADGEVCSYISRVIYNKLNNTWIVDGMHVTVRVEE